MRCWGWPRVNVWSTREQYHQFEAQNVFNHLIISGAAPLNQQEYTLVKAAAGTPFAGQSVLVPFANYKQLLQTQTPPDGTTARRAQASLRITF